MGTGTQLAKSKVDIDIYIQRNTELLTPSLETDQY